MNIVFCKSSLQLPPRSGDDLHTTRLAAALARRGHNVRLVAGSCTGPEELPFPCQILSPSSERQPDSHSTATSNGLTKLQQRFRHYWMGHSDLPDRMAAAVAEGPADVCIAAGLDGPILQQSVHSVQTRIWYAADEAMRAYLSRLAACTGPRECIATLRLSAVQGLYEWAHRGRLDDVWVVSDRERAWMRAVLCGGQVTVVPNGVDVDYYRPLEVETYPRRLAFWGRLDFAPNADALAWFMRQVWPTLREKIQDLELVVIGFSPSEIVRRLTDGPGVQLLANVPDLREPVCSAPVAIFPFVSGGGLKNKVLEAAAMGRATVLSPRASEGLTNLPGQSEDAPFRVCRRPDEWIATLTQLLNDPQAARRLGETARRWVVDHHTWDHAAQLAEASMEQAIQRNPRTRG